MKISRMRSGSATASRGVGPNHMRNVEPVGREQQGTVSDQQQEEPRKQTRRPMISQGGHVPPHQHPTSCQGVSRRKMLAWHALQKIHTYVHTHVQQAQAGGSSTRLLILECKIVIQDCDGDADGAGRMGVNGNGDRWADGRRWEWDGGGGGAENEMCPRRGGAASRK